MSYERSPKLVDFDNFQIQTRTTEKELSKAPVLIVPGFDKKGEDYTVLLDELGGSGYNVMTLNYIYNEKTEPKKLLLLPDIDKLKQEAIYGAVMFQGESTRVNVIAHSKGAYDVAMVAKDHPQLFKNIVMVAPGGLRPKMNIFKAVKSLVTSEHQDELDKLALIKNNAEVAGLIKKNNEDSLAYNRNKLRRMTEGFTSAVKSIKKILPELRKKGIKIGIVCFEKDAFYPPASFDSFTKNNVDRFIVLPGIHGQIRYSSEAARVAINLLQEFETEYLAQNIGAR